MKTGRHFRFNCLVWRTWKMIPEKREKLHSFNHPRNEANENLTVSISGFIEFSHDGPASVGVLRLHVGLSLLPWELESSREADGANLCRPQDHQEGDTGRRGRCKGPLQSQKELGIKPQHISGKERFKSEHIGISRLFLPQQNIIYVYL